MTKLERGSIEMSIQDILVCRNESGILCWTDDVVAIMNWSNIQGLPMMGPFGIGLLGWENPLEVEERYYVKSWMEEMGEPNEIYDFGSEEIYDDGKAEVVILKTGEKIIAPLRWV